LGDVLDTLNLLYIMCAKLLLRNWIAISFNFFQFKCPYFKEFCAKLASKLLQNGAIDNIAKHTKSS